MQGVSDTPAWVVSQANQYAKSQGKTPFVIYQGAWNVMDRSFERDIIPMARANGTLLRFPRYLGLMWSITKALLLLRGTSLREGNLGAMLKSNAVVKRARRDVCFRIPIGNARRTK